ncbi:hypothetical protein DFP93_10988 [Aneurinibacillus soli]|uniref:Uncharacterized protein n=1 Tax=Aneurinibacillus soli TaxID=1500254 RepID=A0A0U4WGF8_9BACL|nr:hypothetical protein [Aneurinibacillus soli]PYE61387.1 hypothetical protein DFP93_10988 [Aneurinibacillus soli]BAU27784.1 hypothetical protein CB4_01958 [Aneurinibacillus soli]
MRTLQKIIYRIDEELLQLNVDDQGHNQERQALEEARRRYLDMIDLIVKDKENKQ